MTINVSHVLYQLILHLIIFPYFSLHSVNRERNISSVWMVTRVTKTGNETQKSLYLLLGLKKKKHQQMLKLSGRTSDPSREREKNVLVVLR